MAEFWNQLPLEEYTALNRENGEKQDNLGDSSPIPSIVSSADVRCGPILKLNGTLENDTPNYRASLLLVVKGDAPQITYDIANEQEKKLFNGEFPGTVFYEQAGLSFVRYTIELTLIDIEQKIKYSINNETHSSFQFFVPAIQDSMNIVSFSCNGFSLGTDTSEYPSSLWLDVLKKHDKNHYHVMLGGGDQIYSDSVKLASAELRDWTEIESKRKKRDVKASSDLVSQLNDYYINHYLKWFGKGFWIGQNGKTSQPLFPYAMSTIPSVNIYDDHDIIDGFGSYNDATMNGEVFSTIGNIAYNFYMIFQHHISPDEKLHESEPSWILGDKPGPFIKQKNHSNYLRLGKEISLIGVDCRTERKLTEIVRPSSYKNIFNRLNSEISKAPEVKHLLVMLGVPILYPRLVWLEWLLTSRAFKPIRALAQKGIIAKGLVNEFDGDIEVLDDLNDHWCSKHHKRERNLLMQRLIQFGAKNGIRVTILSGDVHLACLSRVKSKFHNWASAHLISNHDGGIDEKNLIITEKPEYDPRLIFNVISSAIINAPPPDAMAELLNKRSKIHHFDKYTEEDNVQLFLTDPKTGESRSNKQFLNKRNWSDLILAKQSVYKNEVNDDEGKTIKKFPGPIGDKSLANKKVDELWIKYPLRSDSLVTTIYVEKDGRDYSADTAGYEVLIPRLFGNWNLSKAQVKHLEEHEK